MLPGVSVLCPTYARAGMLAELIECFRRQDYTGPLELVVLNDRWTQELRCAVPGVRVVNCDGRFSTLGLKRTHLLSLATHDVVQWWDDDDLFLPHHVSCSIAKLALGDSVQPVPVVDGVPGIPPLSRVARLPYEYAYDGVSLTLQNAGGVRGYTWRADALRSLFPMTLDRGEWSRIVWRAVELGWLQGAHHDRPTCPPSIIQRVTGHHRVTTHSPSELTSNAEHRAASGAEPAGVVDLVPRWDQDYLELTRNAARPPIAQEEATP